MERTICENCKNYYPHYVKLDNRFISTYCGHCAKRKNTNNRIKCNSFEQRDMAKEKEKRIKNLTILLIKATTLLQNIKEGFHYLCYLEKKELFFYSLFYSLLQYTVF